MRLRDCSELSRQELQVREGQGWLGLSVSKELSVLPGRHRCHWDFSPSVVLASSLGAGGDFLGEADEVGLGIPDPD